ncbi:MAG TPA: HEAT repeat domain-containing protein [Nitrospiraceae bacterium]|jgi:HEAT repeat protein
MTEQPEQPDEFSMSDAPEATDALADRMSDALATPPEQPSAEAPPAETVLEEEKVKDEIDIQIDLLKDSDWTVRREAVVTLGEMGDERCVVPLVTVLRDGDWQVREAAVEALGQVGSPAVEYLVKMLRDWDIRKSAIRCLGKIKDERVLDPLMQQLHHDEFMDDATEALVDLGSPSVERLVQALKDKNEVVRKQAIIALGRIKDPSAIDPLIEMLKDPDWFARLTAAAALEKIGDERGRQAIKPLMKDPDLVVRMRVERILAAWKKNKETANA